MLVLIKHLKIFEIWLLTYVSISICSEYLNCFDITSFFLAHVSIWPTYFWLDHKGPLNSVVLVCFLMKETFRAHHILFINSSQLILIGGKVRERGRADDPIILT